MATVPLGLYLWTRIHQIGIDHIFGVPGDFNLTLLDHVYNVDGLSWVGNTNELNAAYAADGYARARNGAGCLVTTHGVGELSAINGIAGAMTEQVKVVHVVGQTSRHMQQNRMMIHHSIGFQPDHQVFNNASRGFRCAAAEIQSEVGAPEEIDRVLRECFVQSKPVYVFFPIDLVDKPVDAERLKTPLNLTPETDEQSVDKAAKAILEALYASKTPAVLVDCLIQRHNASNDVRQLVDALKVRTFSTNMSKGIIDESHPNYVGLYNGLPSGPGVQDAFRASDLYIVIGNLPSDTNSGGFTRQTPLDKAIHIDPHEVTLQGGSPVFPKAPICAVVQRLLSLLEASKIPTFSAPKLPDRPIEDDAESKLITQSWVWSRIAEFLQPHDVVFGETGTAAFGLPDTTFPNNTHWITQTYYGSIGYATPAAFGVEVARTTHVSTTAATTNGHSASSPPNTSTPFTLSSGRTILVTGDGSLMLTIQEIGNFLKHSLSPIIFLINNEGYTIERVIHGAKQSYNDIVPFDYAHMLDFFDGGKKGKGTGRAAHYRAETKEELDGILKRGDVQKPKGVTVIEVVMDKMDVPWRLSTQIATRGKAAIDEMREAGFKVRQMHQGDGFWQ